MGCVPISCAPSMRCGGCSSRAACFWSIFRVRIERIICTCAPKWPPGICSKSNQTPLSTSALTLKTPTASCRITFATRPMYAICCVTSHLSGCGPSLAKGGAANGSPGRAKEHKRRTNRTLLLWRAMRMRVMLRQHVRIPVVGEITPDTVDMIGTVLRVVILNQKRRPFDGIVVRLAAFLGAGPGKGQRVQAGPLDPRPGLRAHRIRRSLDIVADQVDQMAALLAGQRGIGDAVWYGRGIGHPIILGQNIGRGDRIDDGQGLLPGLQAAEQ